MLLEPFVGKLIDDEHGLAVVLPLLLLDGQFAFLNLDMIFLTELFERIDIAALLNLHDKTDGVSAGAATEAFVYSFGRADGEGACFLVMERTQTDEVSATLAKRDIIADDLFYFCRRVDFFYGFARNQGIDDLTIDD